MSFLKKLFGIKTDDLNEKNEGKPQKVALEEEFQKAMASLSRFKRTAYLPQVQPNPNTYSTASKIGGFPYLRHETDWPVCPNCNKHMQLFLQLNLDDLPERKEDGLVQLFYCTTGEPLCESDLEAFFPFSKAVDCRRIEITGAPCPVKPIMDEFFGEKIITNWLPVDDYPHGEEYENLGIDLDEDMRELMEERQIGITVDKDKLFGWPYWIQSVEYPHDRKTGIQMELLFQFDSENNLPFMFGDSGIGHLTESPDNKDELAFGWACC